MARLDPTSSLGAPVEQDALPNLEVLDIRQDAIVHPDQTCSVRFFVLVQNTGKGACGSFFVGLKPEDGEWVPPLIETCSGKWTGLGGSQYLYPGQMRVVLVYGPGYVGPPILKGTPMQLTAHADMYCAVEELRETDNELTKTVVVGG